MANANLRQEILDTIEDMVTDLLYYDRKEDQNLPVGMIEQAVADGVITADEIVAAFRKHLDLEDK